jgi:hypothetical protein
MLQQSGRNIAKKKSAPTGAPTPAQTARRTLYRNGANTWTALTPEDQSQWLNAANDARYTPFNAYMSAALDQSSITWDARTTSWDNGTANWT